MSYNLHIESIQRIVSVSALFSPFHWLANPAMQACDANSTRLTSLLQLLCNFTATSLAVSPPGDSAFVRATVLHLLVFHPNGACARTSISRMQSAAFTLFPELPLELRQLIWTFTLPGPQIVRVDSYQKPPFALHINRESRAVALLHYELFGDHEVPVDPWHLCVKGYIDFEVDTIQITGLSPCKYVCQKIRHLRSNVWLWDHIASHRTPLWTEFAVEKFPKLSSYLMIIHYDAHLRSFGDMYPPKRLTGKEFQDHVDVVFAETNKHLEAIRAKKALEGVRWEPPAYSIRRYERDAAGVECQRDPS